MAEKEYIEREKLKQAFAADTQSIRGWDVDLFDLLMDEIDEVPAADVAPVRHGEWCGTVCSACGESTSFYYDCDFCPRCGALMDGKDGK